MNIVGKEDKMEAKHKNALIGALLAVVLVMAVGYAAFAQQLTINGTSTITSNWDVHMTDGTTIPVAGVTGATAPTGTLNVAAGGLKADFTASLVSPGDTVTFTVPIVNKGTIDAVLDTITLSSSTDGMAIDQTGLTATTKDGNIKYTVTSPKTTTLAKSTGTDKVTVVAEYVNSANQSSAQNTAVQLTVTMNYVQA